VLHQHVGQPTHANLWSGTSVHQQAHYELISSELKTTDAVGELWRNLKGLHADSCYGHDAAPAATHRRVRLVVRFAFASHGT
jgi:hypothetical protein